MPTYRTPDVYIEEISVFPPSVAEVEAALPAWVAADEQILIAFVPAASSGGLLGDPGGLLGGGGGE